MFGQSSNKSAGRSSSARASKSMYAATTSAEKRAHREATSLESFYRNSQNVFAEVVTVRVVVHTLGSASTHDGRSGNHWSIFLILAGAKPASVRLNMNGEGLDYSGHLEVSDKTFHWTTSGIEYFDYPVVPRKTVDDFCKLLTSMGRLNYQMTGTENGCRYWV